jgi:two-component system C4-dicarboxylate transport response regulator DctD
MAEVFLIEDDEVVRHGYSQALQLAGIAVRAFADAEAALAAFDQEEPAAVISDVRLPGMDGLALLAALRQRDLNLPMILVTGHGDVTMAVNAMRSGAYDFIEKPFHTDRLLDVVRRALALAELQAENRRLRAALEQQSGSLLIGQSAAMQEVRRLVAALAPTGVDILIRGETGSGKEVLAQAIHAASGRSGPFVALNCAALPESVFESEMFGHEAGAFTSAAKRRIGRIEYASGGTLFLDEIESMPLGLQAKLLRVLQERSVERLGSNVTVPVDCRVIAAAKEDLKQLADRQAFRADLYYRLNVMSIALPPLRKRRDDIPLLMAHFINQAAARYGVAARSWSAADMLRWQSHDWPGNVRELKNVADRFCLGMDDGLISASQENAVSSMPSSLSDRLAAVERECIEQALLAASGNVAQAAELLQIPKKTLYDKLARWAIDVERFRRPDAGAA